MQQQTEKGRCADYLGCQMGEGVNIIPPGEEYAPLSMCAEGSHLSPAALAVGGRVEAHRALPSAVGKVPHPTHHPGRGADSDHRLEGGQGLQSKVLLLPTASFPPPLDHQSMTLPYLKTFCLPLSL